jgi:hypothetical protein
MVMKTVRASSTCKRLRTLAIAAVWLAIAGAAHADLMVSNAAGVKAGITKIVYNASNRSVGVQFLVNAPTPTNLTTFTIQKSFDMKLWTNYSASVIVTGSLPLTQIIDFVAASNQFYRMQLINFR